MSKLREISECIWSLLAKWRPLCLLAFRAKTIACLDQLRDYNNHFQQFLFTFTDQNPDLGMEDLLDVFVTFFIAGTIRLKINTVQAR